MSMDIINRHKQLQLLKLLEELKRSKDENVFDKFFPDEGPLRRDLYPKYIEFMNMGAKYMERVCLSANRCHAEGTLVATPQGPRAIESLEVGDFVYDKYGKPTRVTTCWDNGVKEVVELVNRNKRWAISTPNHVYEVTKIYNSTWNEEKNELQKVEASKVSHNHLVNRAYVKAPLGSKSIPEAYALGAFIGNGCISRTKRSSYITISSNDPAVVEKTARVLGSTYKKCHPKNFNWVVYSEGTPLYDSWIKGKYSHEKIVDLDEIKTWDRESALEFVAGLLDTDGSMSFSKDGYTLIFGCQSKTAVEAWAYLTLALWNEPVTLNTDKRPRYKNGVIYNAVVRNPHAIKRICEELSNYSVVPRKTDVPHIDEIGKRSRSEAVKLTARPIGTVQTYDITVEHPEHLYLLANGLISSNSGKTHMACYEGVMHATGIYKSWFQGRRFDKPITMWVVGTSYEKTREVLQDKLLGEIGKWGTGLLRKKDIINVIKDGTTARTIYVKHISGGTSVIQFKSFDAGQDAFMGSKIQYALLDEEPSQEIYSEILLRLTSTVPGEQNGICALMFTPLNGITKLIESFCPKLKATHGPVLDEEGNETGKWVTNIRWSEVPHLTEETKKQMLASIPPYARASRTEGQPLISSGTVFKIDENRIKVKRFNIPDTWERGYGVDPGYSHPLAVAFFARDPQSGVLYLYDTFRQSGVLTLVVAHNIKTRNEWHEGVCDPADPGMRAELNNLGLKVHKADNDVETGLSKMWSLFEIGKLKVFDDLTDFFTEFRSYSRDDKGKLIKIGEDLICAVRYFILSGIPYMKTKPLPPPPVAPFRATGGWSAY